MPNYLTYQLFFCKSITIDDIYQHNKKLLLIMLTRLYIYIYLNIDIILNKEINSSCDQGCKDERKRDFQFYSIFSFLSIRNIDHANYLFPRIRSIEHLQINIYTCI